MATTKVNSEFIAVNAISGTIIADGAITSTHLAANCVDSSELVTGSIDTIHIAANQVTATKIVTNGVLTRHISDDQVTGDKLTNNITIAGTLASGGDLTVEADGAEIFLKSADHTVARIIPRGTGADLDKGLLSLFDAGTEDVRIDTAGNSWIASGSNLGVGTNSPARKIHAYGSSGTIAFKAEASDTSQASLDLQNSNSWFRLIAESGELSIYDQADTAERFRIDTSGNVGIGTNNPAADLHLGATSPHIDLGLATGNRGKVGYDSNKLYIGLSSGTGEIHFKNNINSGDAPHSSGDTKMVITDSGVGIGTTSPSQALDVNGTVELNNLTVGGAQGSDGQVLTSTGSGVAWEDAGGGSTADADGDTKIQVEESSDEDKIRFDTAGTERLVLDNNGHLLPGANNTYDLGATATRWRNIYTNDLQLSNEQGDANEIDGTQGSWTIQEGDSDLFLINRKSGKKYKFDITEIED